MSSSTATDAATDAASGAASSSDAPFATTSSLELIALYGDAFPDCTIADVATARCVLREMLERLNSGEWGCITRGDVTPAFVRRVLCEVLHVKSKTHGWVQDSTTNDVVGAACRFAHSLQHNEINAYLGIGGNTNLSQEQIRKRRCDFYVNLFEFEKYLFKNSKKSLSNQSDPKWRGGVDKFRAKRWALIASRCGLVQKKKGTKRKRSTKKRKKKRRLK